MSYCIFWWRKNNKNRLDFLPLLNVFESKLTLTRLEILLILQLTFRNSGFHNHLKHGKLFLNKKLEMFSISTGIRHISETYCWWKKSCTSWSWKFIPLFTGFYTSHVVVWDFFHQSYQQLSGLKGSSFRASYWYWVHRSSVLSVHGWKGCSIPEYTWVWVFPKNRGTRVPQNGWFMMENPN